MISGSLKALKALQDEEFSWKKRKDGRRNIRITKAVQAFNDKVPFRAELLKPKTFGDFLSFTNPNRPMFNQLASEIPWWDLLNQIEETVFLMALPLRRRGRSLEKFGKMKR